MTLESAWEACGEALSARRAGVRLRLRSLDCYCNHSIAQQDTSLFVCKNNNEAGCRIDTTTKCKKRWNLEDSEEGSDLNSLIWYCFIPNCRWAHVTFVLVCAGFVRTWISRQTPSHSTIVPEHFMSTFWEDSR